MPLPELVIRVFFYFKFLVCCTFNLHRLCYEYCLLFIVQWSSCSNESICKPEPIALVKLVKYCVLFFHLQGFTELILIDLIKIFDENELEVRFSAFYSV